METKTYIVVASVGMDRPGLVHKISHEIKKNGGNIDLQRSTKMAGSFASIMLFSLENAKEEEILFTIESLNGLSNKEFFVYARKAPSDLVELPPGSLCGDLIAEGVDQVGIIETITLLLFQRNINIEAMNYDVKNAPMTGTPLFSMEIRVVVPESFDIDKFKKQLRDIEQNWDIDTIFTFPVDCQG